MRERREVVRDVGALEDTTTMNSRIKEGGGKKRLKAPCSLSRSNAIVLKCFENYDLIYVGKIAKPAFLIEFLEQ